MANKRAAASAVVDWFQLFPPGKIKAQLTRDANVGKLSKKAIDLASISSALFLQQIVVNAASAATSTNEVTLHDIQKACPEFLQDIFLETVPVVSKRRKKTATVRQTTKLNAATLNQVLVVEADHAAASEIKVIEDDEDYD